MRTSILKSLFFPILLLIFYVNIGHSQILAHKPGKVFDIQGVITCKNLKNTYADKLSVNLYVKSTSSNIEIHGVFMNDKIVPKQNTDFYFKSFDFPDMRQGKTIKIKISYKNKVSNSSKVKIYTASEIRLNYFITYLFPQSNSIIHTKPDPFSLANFKKILFKWTSTGTPHNSYVYVFDESPNGTDKYIADSVGNTLAVPSSFLKPKKKYRILNAVKLENIKLEAMTTSSSYVEFLYEYSQYFQTK